MYNGVGLQTARGSGTNGYVQTNMAFIRKSRLETKVKTDEDIRKMEALLNKKPNQEILAHQAKRKVEVKVLELREAMEEDGNYDEEEIEGKCEAFRAMLLNKEGFLDSVEAKSARSGETHQLAAQNEMKNQKAHSAFGIREDYQPGAAFTEEYQLSRQKEAQERAEKREKEKLEKQKRLANTIRERKEKELKDNVKYDWIDSDDDDQQQYKKSKKNSKKSSNSETVKQEKPDSDVEPDVKKERSPSPPSKRRDSHKDDIKSRDRRRSRSKSNDRRRKSRSRSGSRSRNRDRSREKSRDRGKKSRKDDSSRDRRSRSRDDRKSDRNRRSRSSSRKRKTENEAFMDSLRAVDKATENDKRIRFKYNLYKRFQNY